MPSNNLDDVLPSAVAAHSRTVDASGTQSLLMFGVVNQLMAYFAAGLYSTVYSTVGVTSKDLQWLMEQLRNAGYTISLASTSLTISW